MVDTAVEDQNKHSYRKDLGLWSVVMLALGGILGPAVAYAPVYTLADAGPVGILAWPIAMIMILPIGLVFAELGTTWPKAGGVAYYPSKSNGPLVGAINGWSSMVGYLFVGPVIVFAVVEYLSFYYPPLYVNGVLSYAGIAVAEVILVLVFLVNVLRIKHMGGINLVLTIISIILIAIIIISLSFYFKPSNLVSPSVGGFAPYGFTGLFGAITITVFGYGGFRQPIDYSEEVKNPGKSIPVAIIVALLASGLIFSLESLAFAGAINFSKFGTANGNWASLLNYSAPYATIAQTLVLPAIVVIAIIAALIATFKDGVIYYGSTARVGEILSREDKYFPRFLGKMNIRGIPIYSIIMVLIITIVLVALGRSLATIINIMVDGFLLSYAPGAISLMVFRKTEPNIKRPFKLPFANVLAPIAFVVSNLLVYWSGWSAIEIIVPLDFAGVVFVLVYNHYNKLDAKYAMYGIWLPVYLILIVVLSYIGSSFFGGHNYIPFPYDTFVFIIITLIFYYIGTEMGIRSVNYIRKKNGKAAAGN
ncbi:MULTISPECIES: APC family permease [Acidiplasma]|jgi:amino acid transporter|uniref:Amino acid transporter n=1 Tax=Acidiplasma cupricumulans TaxID=312540 RepID=A0A0Q0VWG3_9ARCH|nr:MULTISPECIES: APC family permease [Acidiplasma]KQB35983.1 amino acid transporter [Acidiplasma cupricumulans]WMT54668.1 MAG: APC family permease [Acidiplasma sp.]